MSDFYLDSVYQAVTATEIAKTYDAWAETYEHDMERLGYRHPTVCLALLSRHLPRGSFPVLDAGCGTGLLGEWLKTMGYPHVEALDISQGMLEIARSKGVYDRLHRVAMGNALPFVDGQFAGAVSAGVFTTGHVGPEGLDELVRVVRSGGVIVLTVKDRLWSASFEQHVGELNATGSAHIVEQTPSYVSMPGRPDTEPSRGVVLRVRRSELRPVHGVGDGALVPANVRTRAGDEAEPGV